MAFKILITECQSALGGALFKGFENFSLSIISPQFSCEDWCDEAKVETYLESQRPAVIVNTSTVTADAICGVSGDPASVLSKVCAAMDLTLIHLSSHLVFDVAQQGGEVLSEQDEPQPQSQLGQELRRAEVAAQTVPRSIVLRLPWLLDSPDGIIYGAANALLKPETIKVSDAWRGTPVFVDDVVRVIIAIVQQILCGAENWGVLHFHSSDSCSEAEFIDYVARVLHRKGCSVAPISVTKTEQRIFPGNGWLVGHRCTNSFGVQFRSWRQGTKRKIEQWLEVEVAAGRVALEPKASPEL